ncbi:MAG: DUF2804 domain-containing protein [Clostridia bacterium]|nr:DUF2804 domain-containing protein [Clostridia bacterium]NCC44655.1 DUF2804 domain-containing protein [Clostridia bacterium]
MQTKLRKGELLDEHGNLTQAGYAHSLVKTYDRKKIKAGKHRIKEWDYYLIYNERFGVALTVDDNAYMGLMSISFLDFQKKKEKTVSLMTLFPMGKTDLPSSSAMGVTSFQNKRCYFSFRKEDDKRILLAEIADFDDKKPIRMKIVLTDEPEDSMVIATPFEKKGCFYYNQKIIGMRASGVVEYKGERYLFDPRESFGLLDWGRGVWTYENTWYWSAMQGEIDGKVVGFNLGYGFGNTEAASENMFFYEGKAHKLERVKFHIPGEKKGKPRYLQPWVFSSSDDRIKLTFTPILDRNSCTSVGIILSDQHQVFGWFDGYVILDDGTKVSIRHMLGFAEKVRNKW